MANANIRFRTATPPILPQLVQKLLPAAPTEGKIQGMPNKTAPTSTDPRAFVLALEAPQLREDSLVLIDLMQNLTGAKPRMWGPSIIGFDEYHYTYDSGREGDFFLAGFAPRKSGPVIYLNGQIPNQAELLANLGPHRMGKGCLYIKRLSDIDIATLEKLIVASTAALRKKYPTGSN